MSLPDYPIDALPECSHGLVTGLTNATNSSPSLPATLAIGTMACAAGRMARVLGETPCLWVLLKAPDCQSYDDCYNFVCEPLRDLAHSYVQNPDSLCVDDWEDYDHLIQHSPDASNAVFISCFPKLSLRGWEDQTLSCVGRMEGEMWLQPSLWEKLLCGDCKTGFPRWNSNMGDITDALAKWKNALNEVLKLRIRVAGRPIIFQPSQAVCEFITSHAFCRQEIRLALICALFRDPGNDKISIIENDVHAAKKIMIWHSAAKRRLWDDGQSNPPGGACYRGCSAPFPPKEVIDFAEDLDAKKNQEIISQGIRTTIIKSGIYIFQPSETGIPCGLQQFNQLPSNALSPVQVRCAISEIEILAQHANKEMHWDFGIWRRESPHGLAALNEHHAWCALVVWEIPESPDDEQLLGRVLIKNIWVAKSLRQKGIATRLVKAIQIQTNRVPLFEGPFTPGGKALATAWYRKNGGTPIDQQATQS